MRQPKQILAIPFKLDKNKNYSYGILKRKNNKNEWQFFAGGVEEKETLSKACQRECYEEGNISYKAPIVELNSFSTIPVEKVTKNYIWGEDQLLVTEYCFGIDTSEEEIKLSKEHDEILWLNYEEAKSKLTWDSNKNALIELNHILTNKKIINHENILKDKYIIDLYKEIELFESNSVNAYAYHNFSHAKNVCDLASKILLLINSTKEEIEAIKIAALLHDIGCLEGKDDHEIRGYKLASKYLENKYVYFKERILKAIKEHRIGSDSDDIITLTLVLCDKLDIKKTRITKQGRKIIGNRQYGYINDIIITLEKDTLIFDFKLSKECDIKEMKEYYFTKKLHKIVETFTKKLKLKYKFIYTK